jgi:NAD(P)H-hydrate repair Nnr-like enzyme with NAD(P)H-hydrate dehydratase domain
MHDYWQKQSKGKPLYPNMLWSQPENKLFAGKLVIIGGNVHAFAGPAEAYQSAVDAGVGTSRVLLPDSLHKVLGRFFESGEYTPSTPSGSFGRQALDSLLDAGSWADATLICGDLGRNSETAILLEAFVSGYSGQVTLAGDAIDYVLAGPKPYVQRQNTLLVLDTQQLQKLGTALHLPTAFTSTMDLLPLIEALHGLSETHGLKLVLKHFNTLIVSANKQICTLPESANSTKWAVRTAAYASVWWLQNPQKIFEALASATYASLPKVD